MVNRKNKNLLTFDQKSSLFLKEKRVGEIKEREQ
jgi:hypothetical protein